MRYRKRCFVAMTSVAPASPRLVLQARFQVLSGALSLHPTQVPRAAFPGSNAVLLAERGSRRLPSITALVPRAALRGSRAPQGPGAGRGRGGSPRTQSPRGSVSTRERRQQTGADGRAGVQLQVPAPPAAGPPQAAATPPTTPPSAQASRVPPLTEQGGRRQQPPGHVGVQGRDAAGAGAGRGQARAGGGGSALGALWRRPRPVM